MLQDLINAEIISLSDLGVNVFVVKKYTEKYAAGGSFYVRNLGMLLLKSGQFAIQSGDSIYNLQPRDLLIVPNKSNCMELEKEGKLQFYFMRFPLNERNVSGVQIDSFIYLIGREALKIALDESDYLVMSLLCRLIYAEQKNIASTEFENELRRISTNLLLFELKLIYAKYVTSAGLHISRAEKIVMRFITVLSIHCRKHRTVQFYAGVLFVTSGYLNRVVKEVTGKPVKKMITEAVLAEAVNLLEDSEYTIAAIAEELEFSSLSAFDIFFKKLMHCTPSEYRSNAAERFKSR
jgi:AraC-like DNA-binding protein